MKTSECINEISTALAKAQGEITCAVKDSLNPHFKSRYADLSSVWNACRLPLSKNGLAVFQTTDYKDDGKIILITTLSHTSGQWISSYLPVLMTKNDAQGMGSSLTYCRRYALSALVGVAPDDDDAEASIERKPKEEKRAEPVISSQMVEELTVILSGCSQKYLANFWQILHAIGVQNLNTIPLSRYVEFKEKSIDNREKYSAFLAEKASKEKETEKVA